MMAEVRKGKGVHPKIHTLKAPCPKEGCTIKMCTNIYEVDVMSEHPTV
jgi:hypothetical protein